MHPRPTTLPPLTSSFQYHTIFCGDEPQSFDFKMAKSRFGFNFMTAKPKYTPAEKKGEINELRAQLKAADQERDQGKKRECLKKVIAYMTLGIDTSGLFTDMIMACATMDLVQKKMVYLYLCNHAETNPELSILAINTLQKDCEDDSPLVRGLALRSISSLRIPAVVEHVVPILKAVCYPHLCKLNNPFYSVSKIRFRTSAKPLSSQHASCGR